jgi:hypothetical protein
VTKACGEREATLPGRRSLFAAAAGVVTAALVVGCGAGPIKQYELGATEQCLFAQSAVLSYAESDADLVGEAAPGGGVGISLATNIVTFGFERTPGDVADVLRGAAVAGAAQGPKLHADSNVYVSWNNTPSAAEVDAVEGCLRSGATERIANKYPPAYAARILEQCKSAALSSGASAQEAKSGCGCEVRALQARYTQTQSASLRTDAIHSLDNECATSTTSAGTLTRGHPKPLNILTLSPEWQATLAALRATPDAGPSTRLSSLFGAITDPSWAVASLDSGPNTQPFLALMHYVNDRWMIASLGSAFLCSDMPPPQVKAELQLTCIPG